MMWTLETGVEAAHFSNIVYLKHTNKKGNSSDAQTEMS